MTSKYFHELDEESKVRYRDKLSFNEISLPDPLDEAIRLYTFSRDSRLWPPIAFGDIYNYLVEGQCVYTRERFRNYKALDSYNYFYSGKVKNILAFRNKTIHAVIVTCDVQASQTLKVHHRPWIVATLDGVVFSGHCTCMAGLGEVCSHVAALLFALEVATREGPPSSTSMPCKWNKCVKEVEPLAVVDIDFSHKRKKKACKRPYVEMQMPSTSAYNNLLEVIKKTVPDAPILKMLSDEDTSTASETERQEVEGAQERSFLEENVPSLLEHYKMLNERLPCDFDIQDKIQYLIENSVFSKEYITNLEKLTRAQYKSPLWVRCRQGRITASLFGRILRCTEKGHKNLIETILYQNFFSNNAMKYGQMAEELAKSQLKKLLEEQHVNAQIIPTGFLIDDQYGFLGATPDGMFICDCCDSALIEIKCPYKGIGISVQKIDKKKFFLDEDLNLRQNHIYYDQIQGQMDIWNMSKCYFVTYTDIDMHIQVIEYDSQYWNPCKSSLIDYFKNHVLPEVLKRF